LVWVQPSYRDQAHAQVAYLDQDRVQRWLVGHRPGDDRFSSLAADLRALEPAGPAFAEDPPRHGSRSGSSGLERTTIPVYPREPGYLVLARVVLAQGEANGRWRCWTGCTRQPPRTGSAAVKKHVSHILDKLGAASRTEAVARARQLALIP
jgi:hypothetical protein